MPSFNVKKFPIRLNLDPVYVGAKWDGLTVSGMSSSGTTFASALSSVEMSFQLAGASTEALELTSGAGEITITDSAGWAFRVERVNPWSLAAGTYGWSIVLTDSAGLPDVYFVGTICSIADPVS